MYCDQVRHKLNQFVDTELSAFESHALQRHLDDCTECSLLLRELRLVRDALSALVRLSEGNRRRMRRALLRQTHRKWSDYPREVLDNLRSCLRDLDRHAAVCRLSAVPLSLAMMVLLAYQLPQLRSQNWTFQIYATQQSSPSTANRPPVLVQGLQSTQSVNGLLDTAWRIPYEDSFSLVAEVQPEGNAAIENILEYPKTLELLDAVNLTLQESHFERPSGMSNAFLIYSFQKVDVYEGL